MKVKYLKEWICKAEQDYHTILLLSRERKNLLPDIICFHAQQCVEKYLKSLLVKHGLKVPKTHNLIYLKEQLIKYEPELEFEEDILRDLNQYAVEFRYPGEMATKREAREAIKKANKLRKIFLDKLLRLSKK